MDKFNYEANGYNRAEVNKFVTDVIKETEGIIKKCKDQKKEIRDLKDKLSHYEDLENTLKQSLINAEKTADNVKRLAREEADIIVSDAKHNASRIVGESLLKARKIEQEADTLERNVKIFKRKLKIIVEQQMAVVEEIETLDLEDK
ncbi:MAG TPA: DivIVA domain-containing protein [Candidatus Onthousia excrementipullorum]|uniref:DivIVA domain-containing protein n=1 Tax=Candidatus Onthousia excrementipullorum TaxID=2840884 RepID=A0A9D1DUI1_9FIRM|nr:DivIVA domain-containing protein [Candidatus Onthousia excrementipullorum]